MRCEFTTPRCARWFPDGEIPASHEWDAAEACAMDPGCWPAVSLLRGGAEQLDERRLMNLDAPLGHPVAHQAVAVLPEVRRRVLRHHGKSLCKVIAALVDAEARFPQQLVLLLLPQHLEVVRHQHHEVP